MESYNRKTIQDVHTKMDQTTNEEIKSKSTIRLVLTVFCLYM